MKNVSPFVVVGALRENKGKSILVNVLAPEKVPIKFTCSRAENLLNFTKDEFEYYLARNNSTIPSEVSIVILYCGSWSCNAAEIYYHELKKRGVGMSKVYDYKGSIHEWAMYSIIYPEKFQVLSYPNYELMNEEELRKLAKDMMHSYLVKDEKKEKRHDISKLVKAGL